jgi:hypothetical protein
MFEKREFQRPTPHGWLTLVFPHIHDQNTNLEVWVDQVYQFFDSHQISRSGLFWCLTPQIKVKKGDIAAVSPVFFFKDKWSAIQTKWRFSGEFTTQE